jgi:F-type H+-transporting ATPase subunit gamma
MSRRRKLEAHRRNLAEIREVMNSMKTLAYMETRKLSRYLEAQQSVVEAQRRVAADLLAFHPGLLPAASAEELAPEASLYLLLGSERGLCGDCNRAILRLLDTELPSGGRQPGALLCIGHKLAGLMGEDARLAGVIEGAAVAEEIPLRLGALVEAVHRVQRERGLVGLVALAHGNEGVARYRLMPPFTHMQQSDGSGRRRLSTPPLLNERPEAVFSALVEQHLPALLQWLLYSALMAENHLRLTHLDSAVRHLDETSRALARRSNILRQEEIVEEIEVILLSAESIAANRAAMGSGRDR